MAMSIDEAIQHCEEMALCAKNGECGEEHRQLAEWLRELKRLRAEPVRHGQWLCVDTDTEQFFLCNRCKKKEYRESDYCPNCGAKMYEEVSE